MPARGLRRDHGGVGAPGPTLSPAIAAGVVGIVFGLLAAPGLTWLDAGELGAAAWEAGIAHPPGFPLFSQIHGLVMHALPIGDAAFRGNLASGLLGAAAIAALVQTARTLGVRPAPALAGGLLAGLNALFLTHATAIEVYTGAALWVAVALWLVARLHRAFDARDVGLLGLWIGLAAGHHAELRLFVLIGVPLFVWKARGRTLLIGLGAAVFGGLIILWLPLRSSTELWRDWGDPSSVGAVWDHLMGTRIRAAYSDAFAKLDLVDAELFGEQLMLMVPGLLLLGLLGMIRAVRAPGGRWILAVWLVDTLYAITLNPMGLPDMQNGVPGLVALGLGAAFALDVPKYRISSPLLLIICLIGAAPAFLEMQQSRGRGLTVLLDAADSGAAPEAMAFVASDSMASGYAFRQVVEGARPDLAVIVRQHAWDRSSVGPVTRRLPHSTVGWRPDEQLRSFTRLYDGWPVVWEWATGLDSELAPEELVPAVPWFRRAKGRGPSAVISWTNRGTLSAEGRRQYGLLLDDLTRWWLGRDPAKAVAAGRTATLIDPQGSTAWLNLGQALLRAGDRVGAFASTQEALALDPDDPVARLNFARLSLPDEPRRVAALLDSVIDADPTNAAALGVRGVARAQMGDLAGARRDWEKALAIDPRQPEAVAGMAQLNR